MEILCDVDLKGSEIQNAVTQNLDSAPPNPKQGQKYYNRITDVEYVWNETEWVPLDARKASNIPISALAVNPLDRANHFGSQTVSTISDFTSASTTLIQSLTLKKVSQTIGDGSTKVFTITHNLNTRDIHVDMYDTTTFNVVECDCQMTTVNTITITFATAPTANKYRVVIIG